MWEVLAVLCCPMLFKLLTADSVKNDSEQDSGTSSSLESANLSNNSLGYHKASMFELSKEIDMLRGKYGDYENSMNNKGNTTEEDEKVLEELRNEIMATRAKYAEAKQSRNDVIGQMQKEGRNDTKLGQGMSIYSRIEISGIPEFSAEDAKDLAIKVGKAIGAETSGIVEVYRRKTRHMKRPIVVQFDSDKYKSYWLIQGRAHPITAKQLDPAFPEWPVKVLEYLSAYAKQLRAKTKQLAIQIGYKWVWVKRGRIYIQKDQWHTATEICSDNDLEKFRFKH